MFKAVRPGNGILINAIGIEDSSDCTKVSDLIDHVNKVRGTDYELIINGLGAPAICKKSEDYANYEFPLHFTKGAILIYDFIKEFRSFADFNEVEKNNYRIVLDEPGAQSQSSTPYNKVIHQQLIRIDFSDPKSVKDLMNNYSSVNTMLFGTNQNGETQTISIAKDSVVVVTYQDNHYVRTNHYDSNGICVAEMYDSEF